MSKYKLIQWYPSLPDDWEKGMKVGLGDYPLSGYKPCNIKYNNKSIRTSEVKNNPEFWEKIAEKDYEIMAFTDIPNTGRFYRKQGDYYKPDDYNKLHDEKQLLNSDLIEIYSVRRLTRNEIFTVGDTIISHYYSYGKQRTCKWTISSIQIRDGKCILFDGFGISKELKDVEKREYLFTSEDGYKIYDGSKYYYVNHFSLMNNVASKSIIYNDSSVKRFKYKENAEKWIKDNKPKFSKKDIKDALEKSRNKQKGISEYFLKKELNL